MGKFIVEKDFWTIFPECKLGILICKGVDNISKEPGKYTELIRTGEKEAHKFFKEETLAENREIAVWRAAYQKFKTKKGARCSIEALLKRVKQGNALPSINPLVDIYNYISLKYALPCGGEDIDTFAGDIMLTLAEGNEAFIPLGSQGNEPPYPGEVVYKDDQGIICRCWNWREGLRTIITENTKNAFLCIESIDPSREEDLKYAVNELKGLIEDHLGAQVSEYIVENGSMAIDF